MRNLGSHLLAPRNAHQSKAYEIEIQTGYSKFLPDLKTGFNEQIDCNFECIVKIRPRWVSNDLLFHFVQESY